MTTVVQVFIIAALLAYFAPQLFISAYIATQARLLYLAWRQKRQKPLDPPADEGEWFPPLTVQLPVFNEFYVVERLIDAVATMRYPKEKLEIQVLDDSTDETTALVADKVAELQGRGFDISHIRRPDRTGFKAGALANGLSLAKGELIAIFDADFLPGPEFLLRTVPHFRNKNIGVVQTRWAHVNEDYSLMTRLQAFSLDAHFNIEQQGRNAGGLFINFNGTAGVWRKSCILDAGNWQSDTLTEDLDLSYRAQLKGWKFKYLGEVDTPAELPVTMSALKTQQFRWSKGAAECVRKNLPAVLVSRKLSPLTKIHALFHLTNSTVFTCILITALFSIPFLFIREYYQINPTIYFYAFFSLLNLVPLGLFYWVSARARHSVSLVTFLRRLFLALSFSMGFSLQNSVAVWQGYLGKKIPFIRTPKYDIRSRRDSWRAKKYLVAGIRPMGVLEGVLAAYFLVGIYLDVYFQTYVLLPYHIMLATGFGTVFAYSLYHAKATPELAR